VSRKEQKSLNVRTALLSVTDLSVLRVKDLA
jgi:hypothetical protein